MTVFFGDNLLTIQGTILAVGEPSDSIYLTSESGTWKGIRFSDNSSSPYMSDNVSSQISHCVISNITSGSRGGIHVSYFDKLMVSNSHIHNCHTPNGALGYWFSHADILNCLIENNSSSGDGGGGIYLYRYGFDDSKSVIDGCILRNNSAANSGGGIYAYGCSLDVYNCLIVNNTAGKKGGGTSSENTDLIICNTSIINNTSTQSGGSLRHYHKTFKLVNSIIWANNSHMGDLEINQGGYSLIVSNCLLEHPILVGEYSNNHCSDPLLDENYIPLPGSWAINTGTSEVVQLSLTDLLRNPRIQDSQVDIGAIEYQSTPANRKPTISIQEELSINYNDEQSFIFSINDPDTINSLSFDVFSQNENIIPSVDSVANDSGFFTLQTSNNYRGTDSLLIVVNDNSGEENANDSTYVTIHVGLYDYLVLNEDITEDSYWSGTVIIDNSLILDEEAHLDIAPGTQILFNGPYFISFNGFVKALGSQEEPIYFGPKDPEISGEYNYTRGAGIRFSYDGVSDTTVLSYCNFTGFSSIITEGHYRATVIVSGYSHYIFDHCSFTKNYMSSYGGFDNNQSLSCLMNDCLFKDNFGFFGTLSSLDNITLKNTQFISNLGNATAHAVFYGDKSYLENCLFKANNSPSQNAGSVAIRANSDTTIIVNSVFDSNLGAQSVINVREHQLFLMMNSTFTNNNLTNSTATSIKVYDSPVFILNTIFDEPFNNYTIDQDWVAENTSLYVRNCLIQNPGERITIEGDTAQIYSSSPSFRNSYEGDYALASHSEGIDMGTDEYNTFLDNELNYDFYGSSRVFNDTIDIGAAEYSPGTPPSNLYLSDSIINEGQAIPTMIGRVVVEDGDADDVHQLVFYTPEGESLDNYLFGLEGDSLLAEASFSYPDDQEFRIGIKAYDLSGDSIQKVFTIYVNQIPTNLSLSDSGFYENIPAKQTIGLLSATDDEELLYRLLDSRNMELFEIIGNELVVKQLLNYESDSLNYNILVEGVDAQGLVTSAVFPVHLLDTNDAPSDIQLSAQGILENSAPGTLIGIISAVDEDACKQQLTMHRKWQIRMYRF